MAIYYVNKNQDNNGDNEVHREGCNWMPNLENRVYLGNFNNCAEAVARAKTLGYNANGCYYCSGECHTS